MAQSFCPSPTLVRSTGSLNAGDQGRFCIAPGISKLSSLTIFFPFLNDEQTVFPLISQAHALGAQLTQDLEVIALHGGNSRDKTFEEILRAREHFPNLRVIDKRDNREGYAVIRHGFSAANKEWIFYTDGDGQYSLSDLPALVREAHSNDVSIVNGYKRQRSDTWLRRLGGLGYRWFSRSLFKLPIRDIDCDFRLIRKAALDSVTLEARGASILTELVLKLHRAGARFGEVPVSHFAREYGSSNYSLWSLFSEKLIGDLKLYLREKKAARSALSWMHQVEGSLWWYEALRGLLIDALQSRGNQSRILYDIGCGTGANSEAISRAYAEFDVEGVDISEEAVAICNARSVRALRGTATCLTWKDGSADIIIMMDVLCMLNEQEQEQALREARRVLKSDGVLILHEPAFSALHSQHDIACGMKARFTKRALCRQLDRSGFGIEFATYRVTALFPLLASVKMLKNLIRPFLKESRPDFSVPVGNRLFAKIQFAENRLTKRRVSLPIGSSIMILANPIRR